MGFENLKVDFGPFPGGFRSSKQHISTYLVKLHPNPRKNRGVNPIIFAENPLSCFEKSAKNKKIAQNGLQKRFWGLKMCFLRSSFFWIFRGRKPKFSIFANENRKLWGFHLEKPHNFFFEISDYGVFANENPIIFDFHLQNFGKTP